MKILKDGTVKYKPSAYNEQNRLLKPSFPMPILSKGQKVKVFMGAGWSSAYVISSAQDCCVVELAMGNRRITIRDARSIQIAK